jgi:tetratricopeptide (TPR) repeat protein
VRSLSGIALVTFFASILLPQRPTDAMTQQQMRNLHDLTKNAEAAKSEQERTPLLGGADDDPTLAADQMDHEPPPAARKAALHAEHLSKKKQHEHAIEEFKKALALDPAFYEYFSAGNVDAATQTLTALTQRNPKRVLAFDNLAIILCQLHRYVEAETVARKPIRCTRFPIRRTTCSARRS